MSSCERGIRAYLAAKCQVIQPEMRVELVADCRCLLAENPLWNVSEQALYWTDIEGAALYRYFPSTQRYERFFAGEVVGGFTFQDDNSILLFETNRIAQLFPDGRRVILRENIDADMRRFNDVMADPEGRVFAGTNGTTRDNGGLYRADPDGAITRLFQGTGCSNGMAFSPDLKHLYWTCTTTRSIFRFSYQRATGELSEQTLFYSAPEAEGAPDGMTIDTEGNLWTCRWGGSAVLKLSSSGELLDRVVLPVEAVTSAVFGGRDLSELYVTTARGREAADSHAGSIYRITGVGRGLPEFRSTYR